MSSYILVKQGSGYVRVKKNRQPARNKKQPPASSGGVFMFIVLAGVVVGGLYLFSEERRMTSDDNLSSMLLSAMQEPVKPLTNAQMRAVQLINLFADDKQPEPYNIEHPLYKRGM